MKCLQFYGRFLSNSIASAPPTIIMTTITAIPISNMYVCVDAKSAGAVVAIGVGAASATKPDSAYEG